MADWKKIGTFIVGVGTVLGGIGSFLSGIGPFAGQVMPSQSVTVEVATKSAETAVAKGEESKTAVKETPHSSTVDDLAKTETAIKELSANNNADQKSPSDGEGTKTTYKKYTDPTIGYTVEYPTDCEGKTAYHKGGFQINIGKNVQVDMDQFYANIQSFHLNSIDSNIAAIKEYRTQRWSEYVRGVGKRTVEFFEIKKISDNSYELSAVVDGHFLIERGFFRENYDRKTGGIICVGIAAYLVDDASPEYQLDEHSRDKEAITHILNSFRFDL